MLKEWLTYKSASLMRTLKARPICISPVALEKETLNVFIVQITPSIPVLHNCIRSLILSSKKIKLNDAF